MAYKNRKNIKKKIWKQFDELSDQGNNKELLNDTTGNNQDLCSTCDSLLQLNLDGFYICSNTSCGRMNLNILDQSAEWRFYGADDNSAQDPTRCGMPINPLLEESSYGCKILNCGPVSYEMIKIKRYTEWQSMPYKEKSQYDEFQRISCMAHQGGISKNIIDDAICLHKKISEHQTFRGLNRDGIISASIYISCRKNNNPRTAKEIANIFKLDVTSATKGCKNAIGIINTIEKDFNISDKIMLCNTSPKDFINRFCSKLNINREFTKLCEFISLLVEKNEIIPENTPHSIAAGIIYLVIQVFELNITKKDVNIVSGISEVTINKCYKKLDEIKEKLIPFVLCKKYNIVLQ